MLNNAEPIEEIKDLHKKCQKASRNKEYLRGQIDLIKSLRNILPGINKKHLMVVNKKWRVDSRSVLKDVMTYIKMRDRAQKEWLQDQNTLFHTYAQTINKLRKENNG